MHPEDPGTLTELGDLYLAAGELGRAEGLAVEALRIEPQHQSGRVLMGHLALRRGNIKTAKEHAVWALQIDASDRGALRLMANIKARENWYLGLCWRFCVWLGELGEGRAVAVLMVAYFVVQVSIQVLSDLGQSQLSRIVSFVWIGLCVYTWIGPGLFKRKLQEEISEVKIGDF